jgi:hypothetical protein
MTRSGQYLSPGASKQCRLVGLYHNLESVMRARVLTSPWSRTSRATTRGRLVTIRHRLRRVVERVRRFVRITEVSAIRLMVGVRRCCWLSDAGGGVLLRLLVSAAGRSTAAAATGPDPDGRVPCVVG